LKGLFNKEGREEGSISIRILWNRIEILEDGEGD
jgi:hypothetical protein